MPPTQPGRPPLLLLLLLLLTCQVMDFLFEKWKLYGDQCHYNLSLLPPPAAELVCNRTFDRYSCWPDTPPNTTARVSCPWYLPWHHKVQHRHVFKRCGPDGRWVRGPQGQPWRNASQCQVDAGELKVQREAAQMYRSFQATYTVGYCLSLGALLLALAVLLGLSQLHCTRTYIHMHLFASFALRASSVLAVDALLKTRYSEKLGDDLSVSVWLSDGLAAGGGPAPASPARLLRLPRAQLLRPLPGHRLGRPGALRRPLGSAQVSVRERPVLDQQRPHGLLVGPASARLPGRSDQLRHLRPRPPRPGGQAPSAADAPQRLQVPAGQVHADAHPPAGRARGGLRLRDRRARAGHAALRQALLRPVPQLLPGPAGGRSLLLPQQGGAVGVAAALVPLAPRQGAAGGACPQQPPGLGLAPQRRPQREAAAQEGRQRQQPRGRPGPLRGDTLGRQPPRAGREPLLKPPAGSPAGAALGHPGGHRGTVQDRTPQRGGRSWWALWGLLDPPHTAPALVA
ncbi:glucagon receptor isoform X3 [Dasypus novemcinctus]|uniref:glucagon receptor isoform X3 n=1 Tax=Dasypus novemcinctus TaxID=9361 RepID=UPI00265EA7FA|nr:glucagon receptor isoform X3 [Dasypus novemcinctus]